MKSFIVFLIFSISAATFQLYSVPKSTWWARKKIPAPSVVSQEALEYAPTILDENKPGPGGVLPCAHTFHQACIRNWVERKGDAASCPLCRVSIKEVDIAYIFPQKNLSECAICQDILPLKRDVLEKLRSAIKPIITKKIRKHGRAVLMPRSWLIVKKHR